MSNLITNVEIVPIMPNQGHIAFANVVFEDKLALNGIAIHTCLSRSAFRLVYPTKQLPNGKVAYLYHPLTKEISHEMEDAIIGKYQELLENNARD